MDEEKNVGEESEEQCTNKKHEEKRVVRNNLLTLVSFLGSIASILALFFSGNKYSNTITAGEDQNIVLQEQHNGESVQNQVIGDNNKVSIIVKSDSEENTGAKQEHVPTELTNEQSIWKSAELISEGCYWESIRVLDYLLDKPLDAETRSAAYYNRGIAYNQLDELGLAYDDFQSAVNALPREDAYYNMGVIKYTEGKYSMAVECYNNALAFDENERNLLARALAYEKNGQYDLAENDYLIVIAKNEGNKMALDGYERMHMQEGYASKMEPSFR